jgi:hypothetical protein
MPVRTSLKAHIERPAQDVREDHGREEEELRGAHEVDQILAAACIPLLVLVVGDERIGEHGDDLVEKIERRHVGGEGHALGTEDGHRKTHIVARLSMLAQAPHVPYVVARRQEPEKGGDQPEDHRQPVRSERDRDAGQYGKEGKRENPPLKHIRGHRQDRDKGRGRSNKGDRLPSVDIPVKQVDEKRRHEGDGDGDRHSRALDHLPLSRHPRASSLEF